jgi:hypothetical protein
MDDWLSKQLAQVAIICLFKRCLVATTAAAAAPLVSAAAILLPPPPRHYRGRKTAKKQLTDDESVGKRYKESWRTLTSIIGYI